MRSPAEISEARGPRLLPFREKIRIDHVSLRAKEAFHFLFFRFGCEAHSSNCAAISARCAFVSISSRSTPAGIASARFRASDAVQAVFEIRVSHHAAPVSGVKPRGRAFLTGCCAKNFAAKPCGLRSLCEAL